MNVSCPSDVVVPCVNVNGDSMLPGWNSPTVMTRRLLGFGTGSALVIASLFEGTLVLTTLDEVERVPRLAWIDSGCRGGSLVRRRVP